MSRPERWPSGRRRAPAKGVWVKSPSRVRIPPSPPYGQSILAGFDHSVVAATKRGFEPEIWKRGFDKIACGDFGRRARVARRARAEGPSQSLPPSPPSKNPSKSRFLRKNGISGEKPAAFYCQPTASYVGILVHSYDASAVAARLLIRVLPL
jgi:hypothetical protein